MSVTGISLSSHQLNGSTSFHDLNLTERIKGQTNGHYSNIHTSTIYSASSSFGFLQKSSSVTWKMLLFFSLSGEPQTAGGRWQGANSLWPSDSSHSRIHLSSQLQRRGFSWRASQRNVMFLDPRNVGRTVRWFSERSTWSILLNILQTLSVTEWSFDLLTSINLVLVKYLRNANWWMLLAEKLRWNLPMRGGGLSGSGSSLGKWSWVLGWHQTQKLKSDGRLMHVQFRGQFLCDLRQTNFFSETVVTYKQKHR